MLWGIYNKTYPHFDNLPFKTLSEHLGKSRINKTFEGKEYLLNRRQSPMVRLHIDGGLRLFPIPVIERFHRIEKTGNLSFELVELFLVRETMYPTWQILIEEISTPDPASSVFFLSTKSEIISGMNQLDLDRELLKIDLPSNFIELVESHIGLWISGAIKKREVVLKELRKLQKKFPLSEGALVAK